jgi:hypothetical protein
LAAEESGIAMTMDPAWRDFAALWGAGLSTLLVLAKLLPSRPRFHLEPGDRPSSDLTLRIINPSKNMRLVRELFRYQLSGSEKALGIYTGKTPLDLAGVPGSLLVAIKGEHEKEVSINCVINQDQTENNRWLVCFGWQGQWIIPIWFPVLVFISTKRASRLNAAL